MLVGRQGLNVPRAASYWSEESHQHSLHHSESGRLNLGGSVLNPEGDGLNPDIDALNLVSADEAAWQFFGDGLLQSDEDELALGHLSVQIDTANRETASASSAAPSTLAVLGQATTMTRIQSEAHTFRGGARLEEGGDKDPDIEVRYDGDTSDDAVSEASGPDLNLPAATNAPDLNLPAATNAPDLNLPAATEAPDLNLPSATKAPGLNFIPPAISAQELSLTSATGALVLLTRSRSFAALGKEEAEQPLTAGPSRTSERRATLLSRFRVLRVRTSCA